MYKRFKIWVLCGQNRFLFSKCRKIYIERIFWPKNVRCDFRQTCSSGLEARTDHGYTKIDIEDIQIFSKKTFFRFMGYFQRYIKIHFCTITILVLSLYYSIQCMWEIKTNLYLYSYTVLMSDSNQNKLNCNTKYRWTQPDKNYLSVMSERIIVYKTLYDFYLSKSFIYNIKQTYMCAKNCYFHYHFGVLYDTNS